MYRLYNNYLSPQIQAQAMSIQHNYEALVVFLKQEFGKIEVLLAGLLAELELKRKPNDQDLQERADSLLAIMNVSKPEDQAVGHKSRIFGAKNSYYRNPDPMNIRNFWFPLSRPKYSSHSALNKV